MTTTTSDNIFLEAAEKYIQKNISIFPIPQPGVIDDNNNTYDGKRPSRPWSEYQNSLPTSELLQKWFQTSSNNNNIAITTGDISCLIVLDIDGDRSKRIFESQLLLKFSESLRVKTLNTTHVQTGGGGAYIWFKYRQEDFPEGIGTKPYLRFKDHDEICLKANGSYVIAPAYIRTNRDELVFSLSGYLHRGFVSETSLLQIIQQLAADDEEKALRLRVAQDTCKKARDSDNVSGYQRLLEALVLSLGADS